MKDKFCHPKHCIYRTNDDLVCYYYYFKQNNLTINSLWTRPLLTTYYLFGFINNVNYQIQLILIIVQNPFGLSGCGLSSFILIIVQNPFGSSGCGLSSFTAFCSFIIRSKPIWLEWLWVKFISLGTLLNIVWVYT